MLQIALVCDLPALIRSCIVETGRTSSRTCFTGYCARTLSPEFSESAARVMPTYLRLSLLASTASNRSLPLRRSRTGSCLRQTHRKGREAMVVSSAVISSNLNACIMVLRNCVWVGINTTIDNDKSGLVRCANSNLRYASSSFRASPPILHL